MADPAATPPSIDVNQIAVELQRELIGASQTLLDVALWQKLLVASGRVALIVGLAWLATRAVRLLLLRVEREVTRRVESRSVESARRAETLLKLARQTLQVVIWTVMGLTLLNQFGINIAPLLASAGIVGLAISFGAQNLVRDVISGVFLLLEDQIRVGDVAVINGTGGVVEGITIRSVVLRDLEGTMHVIPTGTITTLANKTRDWSAVVLDLGVDYGTDIEHAMKVIREVGAGLRDDPHWGVDLIEDMEVWGVDSFGASEIVIKMRQKTRPMRQWDVGRELRRRLKQAFDANGIVIPFPQRTLHLEAESLAALSRLGDAVDAGRAAGAGAGVERAAAARMRAGETD